MARPRKILDADLIQNLARVGCTNEEIASACKVSADTIARNYAAVVKEGRDHLRTNLRMWQVKLAQGGNVAMNIWLGKQLLGQSDKTDFAVSGLPIKQYSFTPELPQPRGRFGYAHKEGGNGNGHKGNGDGKGDEDNSRPETTEAAD